MLTASLLVLSLRKHNGKSSVKKSVIAIGQYTVIRQKCRDTYSYTTVLGHVWLLLFKVYHPWSSGIQGEEIRTKQRDGVRRRRKGNNRISAATRRQLDGR